MGGMSEAVVHCAVSLPALSMRHGIVSSAFNSCATAASRAEYSAKAYLREAWSNMHTQYEMAHSSDSAWFEASEVVVA